MAKELDIKRVWAKAWRTCITFTITFLVLANSFFFIQGLGFQAGLNTGRAQGAMACSQRQGLDLAPQEDKKIWETSVY